VLIKVKKTLLFVPGLNLVVGLQQIHYLSEYWARQRGELS
jgi:hypothetical protein